MKYEKATAETVEFSDKPFMTFSSKITYVDVPIIGRCGDYEDKGFDEFECYDYYTNDYTEVVDAYHHLYKCTSYYA